MYGTLRPGSNNQYAERLSKTACHIGSGTVSGRLYLVTHYPALAPAQSAEERVKGDVFEGITAELWQLLDEYEGEQYARELARGDNGHRPDSGGLRLPILVIHRVTKIDSVRRLASSGPSSELRTAF